MSELDVRIVKLEPMRVASFLGFGESPEELAWAKLIPWAKEKGLLDDPEKHRLFGFNNPNPSKGSPNYGYEVWIVIGPDIEAVPKGFFDVIGDTWKRLVTWREDSKYKCGNHQWLEESLPLELPDTEFVLDLYLPISE